MIILTFEGKSFNTSARFKRHSYLLAKTQLGWDYIGEKMFKITRLCYGYVRNSLTRGAKRDWYKETMNMTEKDISSFYQVISGDIK